MIVAGFGCGIYVIVFICLSHQFHLIYHLPFIYFQLYIESGWWFRLGLMSNILWVICETLITHKPLIRDKQKTNLWGVISSEPDTGTEFEHKEAIWWCWCYKIGDSCCLRSLPLLADCAMTTKSINYSTGQLINKKIGVNQLFQIFLLNSMYLLHNCSVLVGCESYKSWRDVLANWSLVSKDLMDRFLEDDVGDCTLKKKIRTGIWRYSCGSDMTEGLTPRQGPKQRNHTGTRIPVVETAFSTVFLVACGLATCENRGTRFQHNLPPKWWQMPFFENNLVSWAKPYV